MERRQPKIIYVDIDGTICKTKKSDYKNSKPIKKNIEKINKLYEDGHTIIYWTARGRLSKTDHTELTLLQLHDWGCKFTELKMNDKPSYDLLICDKTKRIEEI
jgi:histidinol phosphatase-like enzyme